MIKNNRQIVDQIGIITSGLCALHCAAIPILLSFGILGGTSGLMHDKIELVVIIASACLGFWSILNGLIGHGRIIPQLMIGGGAMLIIAGLSSSFLGHGFMAIGGCMLLYGHWLNWRKLSFTD